MLISKFKTNDSMDTNALKNEITGMEEKYNIALPDQYQDFLCKYNGGYTPKTNFKIKKISSDIRGFYGIGDVKLSLDDLDLEEWLDIGLFPIACDSFGNDIALGLTGTMKGKIYFCDHEKGNKADCLAENLKDFLKRCKSEEISEASRRSIKEREELLIANGRGHIITDALRARWQTEIDKYGNMVQEEVIID